MIMPDSEAKKKWIRENTVQYGLKLQRKGDSDLIEYLQPLKNRNGEIKRLLRAAIKREEQEKEKGICK